MTFTSDCSLESTKIRTTRKTMVSLPIVLAVLSMFVWGGGYGNKIDMADLMKRAEEDITKEVTGLMKSGASSRRFARKKITPV